MKNFFFDVDPFVQGGAKKKDGIPPWVLSAHMHDIYSFAEEEYEGWLKERYPNLVDSESGEFIGAMTTNAMEGEATGG
jgi:hypothetical protein